MDTSGGLIQSQVQEERWLVVITFLEQSMDMSAYSIR